MILPGFRGGSLRRERSLAGGAGAGQTKPWPKRFPELHQANFLYSLTPTHFRAEYRLSAPNAALGSGNTLTLQPSATLDPEGPWTNLTPSVVSGDLLRAEIPLSNGDRQFLRFLVLP